MKGKSSALKMFLLLILLLFSYFNDYTFFIFIFIFTEIMKILCVLLCDLDNILNVHNNFTKGIEINH